MRMRVFRDVYAWVRSLRGLGAAVTAVSLMHFVPASAGETLTYKYDTLGRLIKVSRSGTVNNGATECYTYDKADNRSLVSVATATDCAVPSFTISNASVTEGGNLVFTITKRGSASGTTSVDYATASGTAISGTDFTAKSGTASFLISDGSKTVSVPTINDTAIENDETVLFNLSNASGGAIITTAQGTGTIKDDDAAVACTGIRFHVDDAPSAVNEGGTLSFRVWKEGTTANTCGVTYQTQDQTAHAGTNYVAQGPAVLTFAGATTQQTLSVTTVRDNVVTSNLTMAIALSNATNGATIGDWQSYGTIQNIDTAGGGTNLPPVTTADSVQVGCNVTTTANLVANDTDPEGNTPLTLTAVVVENGEAAASVASSTSVSVTGAPANETASATYTVKDSLGASATGTLTIKTVGGPSICM